jgi:tetratricopeptide (TPR) repeat protein
MNFPKSSRALSVLALFVLLVGWQANAQTPAKKIVFATKSAEAQASAEQVVRMIETFQFGPPVLALAQKAVAADPDFAFGQYLVWTFTPPPPQGDPKVQMDKALELAKAKASDGERRYIEAVALVRAQKAAEALPLFKQLAQDYPGDRMVQMMLGQVYLNTGDAESARASFERAVQLDGSTPRAYSFLGNYYLIKGESAKARELYHTAWTKRPKGTAPFGPGYGLAYSYIYDGNIPAALKALQTFEREYSQSTAAAEFPAVFVWNSIARLLLENGQPAEAIKAYEQGYATVPGSKLPDEEKMVWLGRLHHGKGRALAKMGKHAEAWKEAELIKQMIDQNGERGKQFMPAYHYIAGYLKLEGGDNAAAVEHLKQANQADLFHKLLLARAYERTGDAASAQKLYKEIVDSRDINLERALAYPEAKKKLKG